MELREDFSFKKSSGQNPPMDPSKSLGFEKGCQIIFNYVMSTTTDRDDSLASSELAGGLLTVEN